MALLLVLAIAPLAQAQETDAAIQRRRPVRRISRWIPSQGISWQIQFQGTLDLTVSASMYEIDGEDSTAATVAALHQAGRRVACYINAGAWEEWRSDAGSFPPAVIGNDYAGWPGEKWLDVRQLPILAPILRARLDDCARKGFDAVEPDNVDGYQQNTGFPISNEDQLTFNRFLATEAHARGLSIALKNDFDQAGDLADDFDWALSESCFKYGECGKLEPFLQRGKAVLDIEYTEEGMSTSDFCAEASSLKISAILKHRSLDAWRQACSP